MRAFCTSPPATLVNVLAVVSTLWWGSTPVHGEIVYQTTLNLSGTAAQVVPPTRTSTTSSDPRRG